MTEQLDLLEVPESPSPRLAWLTEHNIHTGPDRFDEDDDGPFWAAWQGADQHGSPTAYADTEIGAISALAARLP